ncbi:MAG: rhodanese-like domain-containing protein [Thermodesulfobacteriota bacterium]
MLQTRLHMLVVTVLLSMCLASAVHSAEGPKPDSPKKHTVLDKYIKAIDAYQKWKSSPDKVHVLDVRTPEEYVFVGHAPMARNIPLKVWPGEWKADEKKFDLAPNLGFVDTVKNYYKPGDVILLMCRSGDRAAEAINALAKVGFTNAYNIVDSFEGDTVTDPDSYFDGKRVKNGWKNSGAPWTYDLDPNLIYPPPK